MESTVGETVDDTFEALRRIPQKDLELGYDWLCHVIRQNEKAKAIASVYRYNKSTLWKFLTLNLLPEPKYHFGILRLEGEGYLARCCSNEWEKTGWTYERYAKLVARTYVNDVIEAKRRIRRDRGCFLITAVLALTLPIVTGGGFLGGLTTGVISAWTGILIRKWFKKIEEPIFDE